MPRNLIPSYRRHPRNNRAVVDVYDASGRRTQRSLPGDYGSPESKRACQELISQLQFHGGQLPDMPGQRSPDDLTINELILRFLDVKVAVDYVDAAGQPTSEQYCFRQALKPLARLFGWTAVRDFDAKSLGVVQNAMVSGRWMNDEEKALLAKQKKPLGWCRSNVNRSISRIRSLFRWAVLQKIVPASVVVDLQCLPPLKKGRGGARESEPVTPVSIVDVDTTLPFLPPVVGDMVRLQLLLACRPGELCALRTGDIDRSGPVRYYTPKSHKTEHHGHQRKIAIGPKAQLILRQYLKTNPDAPVFSPEEQDRMLKEEKRKKRRTRDAGSTLTGRSKQSQPQSKTGSRVYGSCVQP